MVDWRELGEVPDSEDDEYESQDDIDPLSLPDSTTEATPKPRRQDAKKLYNATRNGEAEKAQQAEGKDIWDIPSSQDTDSTPRQRPTELHVANKSPVLPPRLEQQESTLSSLTTLSTPLSSSQGLPTIDELGFTAVVTGDRPNSPATFPQDEISNNLVQITSPTPVFHGAGDTLDAPQPLPAREQGTHPSPSQDLGQDDDIQEARRAAIRYERSLRSRKPEQLRPYFMEQARYNHSWKEHGLRPVRIINKESRRRQDESSSEGEFEPESQGSKNQDLTEESQMNNSPRDSFAVTEGMQVGLLSSSPLEISPAHRRIGPSSQATSKGDTDDTSLSGDDLPSVEALTTRRGSSMKRSAKRSSLLTSSAMKKRETTKQTTHRSPSTRFRQLSPTPDPFLSPPRKITERSHAQELPPTSAAILSNSGDEHNTGVDVVDDDAETASASSSDADIASEIVQRNSRKIRGVLPASWLRIDQQASRSNLQKKMNNHQSNHVIEGEQRRGVAQRRLTRSKPTRALTFDDSEEEDTSPPQRTTDEVFHHQTRLILEPSTAPPVSEVMDISEDDDMSIFEEDHIDQMRPGKKRQLKLSDSFAHEPKRQKITPSTQIQPRQKPRQPRINDAFTRSTSTGSMRKPRSRQNKGSESKNVFKRSRAPKIPQRSPPQLSILDIIEPNAPRFLKIAARSAQKRRNQGRASPSNKTLRLATRVDNIDVMTALRDWRSSSIQPRASVTAAIKPRAVRRGPEPLQERAANKGSQPLQSWMPTSQGSRTFTKSISSGGTTALRSNSARHSDIQQHRRAQQKPAHRQATTNQGSRPAVLEADTRNNISDRDFQMKKRQLDRLFRQKYGSASLAESVFSKDNADALQPAGQLDSDVFMSHAAEPLIPSEQLATRKSRFRKKTIPKRIDTEAPQFSHANDPLPNTPVTRQDGQPIEVEGIESVKLLGLGPYGTHYTHHFEMFPLDASVYFHSSTLIGSGILERIECQGVRPKLDQDRQCVSFLMGEKILKWSQWGAQVSSELGVVLDFIADCLDQLGQGDANDNQEHAAGAARFLLHYIDQSLNFDDADSLKFFITRWQEALSGFNARMFAHLTNAGTPGHFYMKLAVIYDYLILASLEVLQFCRLDDSLIGEQFVFEDFMKDLTKQVASVLTKIGLEKVRVTYRRLCTVRARERGLREDEPVMHSWVVLMKVLELSQIPRSSFWDIVQEAMAPSKVELKADAQQHETLWEDMFTLLPLTEFGNAGVLVPGRRHLSTTNGWLLPKRLISKVFDLYKSNRRQAPSFNSYCRAIVSRCHYLVQLWGWHKNSVIIGTIFDFFGSQNLEHLRNEEVYQSPAFLRNLAGNPSLDVDAEDRCFHIFLKLFAVTIQKLKKTGATKDIINLIKRTTPNHNRQYLKEQNIHERDLAALRNHHDLLCTQFWAVPPQLRKHVDWPERLVEPISAHKEACLINFRAWKQLSAFIVSSGEASTSLKPFNLWRNTFFQKMITQFDSVATDIEDQFKALSTDVSKSIDPDMMKAMIAMNKSAIGDVIYYAVTASLDVIKLSPDLEAASFALNTSQLYQVFRRFSQANSEFRWDILHESLAILSHFLSKIDEFKENEQSQETESQLLNSAQADDALMVLEHNVATSFFSMVRYLLCGHNMTETVPLTVRADCIDESIILAARMGTRFIQAGIACLSSMFKPGKFKVFDKETIDLSLGQRMYLTLFVTSLLKHGFDDFSDPGLTLVELWTQALVKPQESLRFENNLMQELIRQGNEFVPATAFGLSSIPDYHSNRTLFEFAISWMRQSLRDADSPLKRTLLPNYTKALKSAMQQMKQDLGTTTKDSTEHSRYVRFVRDIIFLIRAHGSDMANIDPFFYQISKEYSPSDQDPQLQVAGMKSYGLRLADGDTRVESQFFYFLYNNFKMALNNNKLGEEVRMLSQALKDRNIRAFILGKMFPALIYGVFREPSAYLLLDVYVKAFNRFLRGKTTGFQLDEDDLTHALQSVGAFITVMVTERRIFRGDEVVNMGQQQDGPAAELVRMLHVFDERADHLKRAHSQLGNTHLPDSYLSTTGMSCRIIAKIISDYKSPDAKIKEFRTIIINDVRQNWVVNGDRLSIKAPGNMHSTQTVSGIIRPKLDDQPTLARDIEYAEWELMRLLVYLDDVRGLRRHSQVKLKLHERTPIF